MCNVSLFYAKETPLQGKEDEIAILHLKLKPTILQFTYIVMWHVFETF